MAKLNLVSPWINYYHELEVFFKEDPYVNVFFDEENMDIKLLVDSHYTAAALTHLLNQEKEFGNVKLTITIVPSNSAVMSKYDKQAKQRVNIMFEEKDYAGLFHDALKSNDIFDCIHEISTPLDFRATYILFKKKVLQYYNDNLGDYHGVKSTLAENIARDIFVELPGVYFCTDVNDPNY